ncbi:hypothetical protein C5167_044433 [Papaver somniferum]|uniref:DUF7722 domain-containing protein n=1 Tax=Papaver somniferum TaxID=3469 RepID=A0A4Y7L8N8_PAPSO|nr:hypothetical protein C5167_044433 [Papaver somniferum]
MHDDEEKKFNKISAKCDASSGFQMPLHYPRYKKSDYEKMEEWKVDMLLREYGLDSFKVPLMRKGNLLWVLSCGLISSNHAPPAHHPPQLKCGALSSIYIFLSSYSC